MEGTQISDTGFFFSRLPSGEIAFSRTEGDRSQKMKPDQFAQEFGSTVADEEARKQAQNLLQEHNQKYRTNFTLAPYQDEQTTDKNAAPKNEDMQKNEAILGQMMGAR